MKKILTLILVLAATLSCLSAPATAQVPDDLIMPYYVYTIDADVTLTINSSGKATVTATCLGVSGVTWIRATTHLEKKVNGVWQWVDLANLESDQWDTSISSRDFSVTKTHQCTSRGTYRAVTVFIVKTASSSETFTVTDQATY